MKKTEKKEKTAKTVEKTVEKKKTEQRVEKNVESYHRYDGTESYDAIVIGSGIGGLTTAALLAKHGGKRVLVLERHYVAGGYTHSFRRSDYEWDVGVHYIGEMQKGALLRSIFDDLTDAKLKWADMGDVYDRIIIGDRAFDLRKGKERLIKSLKKEFPDDAQAIDQYFTLVAQSVKSTFSFFKANALPPWIDMLAGNWLRKDFLGFASQTTRQVLESLTKNQRLIAVLTGQFGDYGLAPADSSFAMHAMVANHYFNGGFYPVGGASRIAETIIPIINRSGGKVLINAEVAEIVIENGRACGVRMAKDGAILRAPIVISDAGVFNTFNRLLPEDLRATFKLDRELSAVRPSLAHLCLYVGLKSTARDLKLSPTNLWIYPNEHHEENLATALTDIDAPFPFVFISFPSAKDPDFERRYPGRATIDILTVASYEHFADWENTRWKKRGNKYQELKEELAQRLLAELIKHVPQVKDHIDYYELSTPLSTKHFANYSAGEIYGLDHTPTRFQHRLLRPHTPVPGLYLTGQDITTCGVAGATMGGVLSASSILERNLISSIVANYPTKRLAANKNNKAASVTGIKMRLCPISYGVGCRNCPIVKVCPLKNVIGDGMVA